MSGNVCRGFRNRHRGLDAPWWLPRWRFDWQAVICRCLDRRKDKRFRLRSTSHATMWKGQECHQPTHQWHKKGIFGDALDFLFIGVSFGDIFAVGIFGV